jgi:hypothetical protein
MNSNQHVHLDIMSYITSLFDEEGHYDVAVKIS